MLGLKFLNGKTQDGKAVIYVIDDKQSNVATFNHVEDADDFIAGRGAQCLNRQEFVAGTPPRIAPEKRKPVTRPAGDPVTESPKPPASSPVVK